MIKLESSPKIKIVVVDSHDLIRKAMVNLINSDQRFNVIDESSGGLEILQNLKEKVPDMILMEYDMPAMNGVQALEIINKRYPSIKIIMMSYYAKKEQLYDIVSKGANGYICKSSTAENLFSTLLRLSYENRFFDAETTRLVISDYVENKRLIGNPSKYLLSEKELIILREIYNGKSSKRIAEDLSIPIHSVDKFRQSIYKKTNTHKNVELIKYAINHRLIQID